MEKYPDVKALDDENDPYGIEYRKDIKDHSIFSICFTCNSGLSEFSLVAEFVIMILFL